MADLKTFLSSTRGRAVAGAAGVGVLVLAGTLFAVAGGSDSPPPTTTTSSTVPGPTTTTAPPPPAPFTGLASADEVVTRPALVLKIDNAPKAAPQAGLNLADVVYEEQVEGGTTRFAAVFQSRDADRIGPIRSARTSDIGILAPLNMPLFGFSGANAGFLAQVLRAPIVDVRWDSVPSAYKRDSSRPAPHNLFTSSGALYEHRDGGGTPPALWGFLADGESLASRPGAQPVSSFTVAFGGSAGHSATWTWDAGAGVWVRQQRGATHSDESGAPITAKNVLVQSTAYGSNQGLPEAQLVGNGQALLFADGHVVTGTWSRGSIEQVTSYVDGGGSPMLLTRGNTWVELPAAGRDVSITGPATP